MPSPEIFTLFRVRTDTVNGATSLSQDLAIQEYKVRCFDFASKGSCLSVQRTSGGHTASQL